MRSHDLIWTLYKWTFSAWIYQSYLVFCWVWLLSLAASLGDTSFMSWSHTPPRSKEHDWSGNRSTEPYNVCQRQGAGGTPEANDDDDPWGIKPVYQRAHAHRGTLPSNRGNGQYQLLHTNTIPNTILDKNCWAIPIPNTNTIPNLNPEMKLSW